MSKILNEHIKALDYSGKNLLVSSDTSSGVSICLFTTVTGTYFGVASASFSLEFLFNSRSSQNVFENKEMEHIAMILLARSKLNSLKK